MGRGMRFGIAVGSVYIGVNLFVFALVDLVYAVLGLGGTGTHLVGYVSRPIGTISLNQLGRQNTERDIAERLS